MFRLPDYTQSIFTGKTLFKTATLSLRRGPKQNSEVKGCAAQDGCNGW